MGLRLLDDLLDFVEATEVESESSIENMAAVILWNISVSLLVTRENNDRQKGIIQRVEKQMTEAGIDLETLTIIKEWVVTFIQKQTTTIGDEQFFDIHEKICYCLRDIDVKIMAIETLED